MFNSEAKASGRLNVVLKDSDGNIKQIVDVDNLVVNSGLAFIASRMKDTTATAMSHMAIGTGTTAAAKVAIDMGGTSPTSTNGGKAVLVLEFFNKAKA